MKLFKKCDYGVNKTYDDGSYLKNCGNFYKYTIFKDGDSYYCTALVDDEETPVKARTLCFYHLSPGFDINDIEKYCSEDDTNLNNSISVIWKMSYVFLNMLIDYNEDVVLIDGESRKMKMYEKVFKKVISYALKFDKDSEHSQNGVSSITVKGHHWIIINFKSGTKKIFREKFF
jgi:hypothetical protein